MSYGYNSVESAKAAMYQSQQYPGDVAQPPSVPKLLEAAIQTARGQNERLREIVHRLRSLRERTFGPEPEQAQTAGIAPQSVGHVYVLGSESSCTDTLISELYSVLGDLERLA